MEAAIFGLIGVALGAILTVVREWWFQSRRDRKDVEFLAVQVVGQLDRYVAGCANVVADDGLSEGQTDQDGYHSIQVTPPKFEPKILNVEWKALPAKLMYEILDLPYRAEVASHSISDAFEYAATPPEFSEGFEERQYQYAVLGIDAARLSVALRKSAQLPLRSVGEWNPVEYMTKQKAKIEDLRQRQAKRHQESLKQVGLEGAENDA